MEQKRLDELINFTLGKNISRLKNQNVNIYTPEDFEKDLHSLADVNMICVCIINLIRSKASPISTETQGKYITSNFLLCMFDQNELDPWYFCYQFNEGKSLEQQISKDHQGTTLSVKKLNIKSIGELKIPMLETEKQRQIGRLYRQSMKQKDLLERQAENISRLAAETIRRIEED